MNEFKCLKCGFRFESEEPPDHCENCKRNGRKLDAEFEELEQKAPASDRTEEQPAYHWKCGSDGYKFVNPGVPVVCPVCERHGRVSKKLIPLTPQARNTAAEAAVDDDVSPIDTPSMTMSKADILAYLKEHHDVKTIKVGGTPVPLEDCGNRSPPTKEDLLRLYLEVSGTDDAPPLSDAAGETPAETPAG